MLTRPVPTAVLVSGGGTNLQALIDAAKAGKLGAARLSLVISSKEEAFALTRAREAGIDARVALRKGKSQQQFESDILALLEAYHIELIVLAGFMSILGPDFVARYPRRILNVHPALIPSFCGKGFFGLRVHEAALEKGVKVTGATVHFVNEVPDGGEILLQKAVSVKPGDTPQSLQRRVMEQAEWRLLPRAVKLVADKIAKGEGYERL